MENETRKAGISPEPDTAAVVEARKNAREKTAIFYQNLEKLQDSGTAITAELKLAEDALFSFITDYDPAVMAYVEQLRSDNELLRRNLEAALQAYQVCAEKLNELMKD